MKRKVWFNEPYLGADGVEHVRRLPGVRFGTSHFGRVRVLYRGHDGRVTWRKIKPGALRARTT